MNIKNFLVLSLFLAQFTTALHASSSQAAYNAAFQLFDKTFNPSYSATNTLAQSAAFVANNQNNSKISWSNALNAAKSLNTPQAMAVGLYLSSGNPLTTAAKFPNADITKTTKTVSFTNLQTALTAAQSSSSSTVTTGSTPSTPSTPSAPSQIGDSVAANWTAAINAFGGSAGITAKSAAATMPTSMTSSSVGYADAQVIAQYLSGATMNATDLANLQAALVANPNNQPSTIDTAAAALKNQMDASLALYNQYLVSVNQPQIKIAAA